MKKYLFLLCGLAALSATEWDSRFSEALKKGALLELPPQEIKLDKTIEVDKDFSILLKGGTVIRSSASPVLRLKRGNLTVEAVGAKGTFIAAAGVGSPRFTVPASERHAVFDVNFASGSLTLKNLKIYGFHGIDGAIRADNRTCMQSLKLFNCDFDTLKEGRGVLINGVPSLGFLQIERCRFEHCLRCIYVNTALPQGAVIKSNTLLNFGNVGIQIGKGGQVADGCTQHLGNAIVHDNQLLGGGHATTLNESYFQGILIYGHNVSVHGNIIRNVTRPSAPVPGRQFGRQLVDEKGNILRGNWIATKDNPHRRLAGAVIYLKANRASIQGNVCTGSGWRSVIEVKTGGKEHFTLVSGNIVDGSMLSADGSFAFECNSGRSMWSNNIVYNLPNQAFVVRSGYENTFLNNLIINCKTGFALSGLAPGYGELIAGNRFINVENPVAIDNPKLPAGHGPDIAVAGNAVINTELPPPGPQYLGRQLTCGDKVYIGIEKEGQNRWLELSGKLVPLKEYKTVGRELAINPLQSPKPVKESQYNNPLHRGWIMRMQTSGEKQGNIPDHVSYDYKNFKTGKSALRICWTKGLSGNWTLKQGLKLKPGVRYRASAIVKGEEPLNLRLTVLITAEAPKQCRAKDTQEWQTIFVDFTANGTTDFNLASTKTMTGKVALVDSFSVKELEEFVNGKSTVVHYEPFGPELLNTFPAKWSIAASAGAKFERKPGKGFAAESVGKTGNMLISARIKLKPGLFCRATAEVPTANASMGVKDSVNGNKSASSSASQTLDFKVPADGFINLRFYSSGLKTGEKVQITNLSIRECKAL